MARCALSIADQNEVWFFMDTDGAELRMTFTNGKTEQQFVVTTPLGSNYMPRAGDTAEVEAANLHRAAVQEYQAHTSVTARAGLLLQNAGSTTAEDVTIAVAIPDGLELAFVEREPPPRVPRKSAVVPVDPSPRSWQMDSATTAHCRVLRVTSSVGLPLLFLTLRDRERSASFTLDLTVTATRPALEQKSQLTLSFVQPEL